MSQNLLICLIMFPVKHYPAKIDRHFNDALPVVIDGADVYDTICPVSKVTGCRSNPLELLQALSNDPVRSRKLSALLADLPTIASDPRLSDDQRVSLMFDKLQTGVPADDDHYRHVLEDIAVPLFKSLGGSSKDDSKISFDKSDFPADGSVSAPAAE